MENNKEMTAKITKIFNSNTEGLTLVEALSF